MKLFAALLLIMLALFWHAARNGTELCMVAIVYACAAWPFAWLPMQLLRRKWHPASSPLQETLIRWPTGDAFRMEDLLRGVAVFGQIGSGKSSGSALGLARAILKTNAGGLVLCSKPEDRAWWMERFAEAGRLADVILFAEGSGQRCNFLEYEHRVGKGDSRNTTHFLTTVAEVLDDGAERSGKEAFWRDLEARIIFNAAEALRLAYGNVTAMTIHDFITQAAYHPDRLADEEWQQGFHNRTLEIAAENAEGGNRIDRGNHDLLRKFWLNEFVYMDDKPRSSGLAGVNNVMHAFNSGLVRDLCSEETTFTPEMMEQGKWVVVDFPVPDYGMTGKFVMAGLKYLSQKHVLRRRFTPGDPPIIFFADECQTVINRFDADFMLQMRSHGSGIVYLTQSYLNYELAMGGREKAAARIMLGQFATKIFHVCDVDTAEYASQLVGKMMQPKIGGSYKPPNYPAASLMALGEWTGSLNDELQNLIEPHAFMHAMRTGGEDNGWIVDSWVIRNGKLFRDGTSCIRVPWRQAH